MSVRSFSGRPTARHSFAVALLAIAVGLLVAVPTAGAARPPVRSASGAAPPNPLWTPVEYGGVTDRQSYGMVYDPILGELVLFGGSNTTGQPLNDTWAYTPETYWHELNETTSPAPRSNVGFVYDAALGEVLLFGGVGSHGTTYNDTWVFGNSGWKAVHSRASPPATGAGQMVYDSSAGYALLLYASPASPSIDAVWAFNGTSWQNITSSVGAPPPNVLWDGSDDPSAGGVLFYGGGQGCGRLAGGVGLTWLFAHGSFTNETSVQTVAPLNVFPSLAMAYDPGFDGVVMFSGPELNCATAPTTFLFRYNEWINMTASFGPAGRTNARLAYYPGVGAVLGLGNEAASAGSVDLGDDSWALLNPFAIANFTAAPIEVGTVGQVVVAPIGGTANLSYTYSGLPPGCATANLSVLPCRPNATGSYAVSVVVRDETGDVASATTNLTVYRPLALTAFTAAPSLLPVHHTAVLRTVVADGFGYYSYAYTGLPPGCTSENVSPFRCSPTAVGNYSIGVTVRDQEGNTAQANVSIEVVPALVLLKFTASPAELELGESTAYAAQVTGGAGTDTFTYSGMPPGCRANDTRSNACTPTVAGNYSTEVVVNDTTGSVVFAFAPLTVAPRLAIRALTASPAEVELGTATELTADVTGGLGSENVSWSGLPDGCVPADVTALSCTPAGIGTYPVSVEVTDAHGGRATANLTLSVVPALSVTAFTADPASFVLGAGTNLTVNFTGGIGPVSFRYLDLPPGCVGANSSHVACVPNEAGTYPVEVIVRDVGGAVLDANLTLTVASPPLSVGGPAGLTVAGILPWAGVVAVVAVVFVVLLRRRRPAAPAPPPDAADADPVYR